MWKYLSIAVVLLGLILTLHFWQEEKKDLYDDVEENEPSAKKPIKKTPVRPETKTKPVNEPEKIEVDTETPTVENNE